jgi:hypothetical protein
MEELFGEKLVVTIVAADISHELFDVLSPRPE